MNRLPKKPTFGEQLIEAMHEVLAHAKGEIELPTRYLSVDEQRTMKRVLRRSGKLIHRA